ncbi:family 16 glycoside hydrolase [Chryseolinea lacunae]|uniref:DUF1080 domain-containing protein n=1 Tax=Chryseolinea lacunae TaxID=2801331 RepID=A0ABS1L521_9BACT|nr:family 16 glycoside hydrolase [Chryseolinea lacunae]MBL0745656.1 DUF1080 domain-containing protein [Chryseolinea lacunae]
MNVKRSILVIMLLAFAATGFAQTTYNVQQLLKEKKFTLDLPKPFPYTDSGKDAIFFSGIAWLTGVEFSTGTIELDLRGQDVFQRSFLGIAFHGVDSATFDVVYFRPFNFQADDPVRKIHAVQYMTLPDYPWDRLRNERNGIYEKAVNPAPKADEWFHARIEILQDDIKVYVNRATTPSLVVKKLNTRKTGKIGLWNEGLPGGFANLVITK